MRNRAAKGLEACELPSGLLQNPCSSASAGARDLILRSEARMVVTEKNSPRRDELLFPIFRLVEDSSI